MREYRFRGFRRKTQEWVFGFIVKREEPYLHDIVIPIGDTSSITYAVERGSLGEYTGLKDKNGIDIYEGDIVVSEITIDQPYGSLTTKRVGKVEISNGMTYVMGYSYQYLDDTDGTMGEYKSLMLSPNLFKIVGNIFENPELMKGEE